MTKIIIKLELVIVKEDKLSKIDQIKIGNKVVNELKDFVNSPKVLELVKINLEEIYLA